MVKTGDPLEKKIGVIERPRPLNPGKDIAMAIRPLIGARARV